MKTSAWERQERGAFTRLMSNFVVQGGVAGSVRFFQYVLARHVNERRGGVVCLSRLGALDVPKGFQSQLILLLAVPCCSFKKARVALGGDEG